MRPGQFVRSWGLAIVLAASAFVAWEAAKRRDIDVVSVEPVAYERSLGTPMLSARRVPRTIQAPGADELIVPALQGAIAGSPQTTCVLVQVGDRVLEPSTNVGASLVPASNQKILTTYAALLSLGEEFRYRTPVTTDAPPDAAGVVNGNLYLIGSGDPFLSTDDWWTQYDDTEGRYHTRLEDLADQIVAQGITAVTGAVVGDETLFDTARRGPWHPRLIDQKQAGPLSALSVNEGYAAWPQTDPGSSRSRSETDNPPVYAAGKLAQLLQERSVTVGAPAAAGPAPAGAVEIAAVESPTLIEIATHINSHSSNFGAEMLLKKLGSVERGYGSTQDGAGAVVDLLAADGVPTAGLTVVDGSGLADGSELPDGAGLAPADHVTCAALATILANAGADSAFASTLAIGGERGSLDQRFVDTPADGRVLAKTGTLNGARSLSGYVHSASDPGVALIFAYVANEPQIDGSAITDVQDQLVVNLTSYPGGPSADALSPLTPIPGR